MAYFLLLLLLLIVVFPNAAAGTLLVRLNRKVLSSAIINLFIKLIVIAILFLTAIVLSISTGAGLILLSSRGCTGVFGNSQSCNFSPLHFLLGISFWLVVIPLFQLIVKFAYRK